MKLQDLATAIGARLLGDADVEVVRVRAVDEADGADLGFAASAGELKLAFATRAGALLVEEGFAADHAHELPCAVLAASPVSRALGRAIEALHAPPARIAGVDPRAVVHADARLAPGVAVGPLAMIGRATLAEGVAVAALAFIGDDVVVGAGTSIGPGAVILPGTRIGARVVVGPNSVLGDEGFVFAPDADANIPVRHVAGVVIGDDVEIGANVCIDRGALRDTRVGNGTKIDNLAQIAHDVVIGDHAVIIAQVGIAGDARVGARAVLAGQAGVKERVRIGEGARVAGQAGVTRDVAPGAAVSGMPAIPHMTWLRSMARLQSLDTLERRVRALEARLAPHADSDDHKDPA